MKGDLIYSDGKLKVIIKRRYAYYYNLRDVPYGRAEVCPYLFTLLDQAGFKKVSVKEQQEKILEKILLPDLKKTPDDMLPSAHGYDSPPELEE